VADLEEQEKLALTDAVLQSTVGITGLDASGTLAGFLGTGTLKRAGALSGILTAEHVVRPCLAAPKRLRFMAPAPDPHNDAGKTLLPVVPVNIRQIHTDDVVDLAFLEFNESLGDDRFANFRVIPELNPMKVSDWTGCMVGYPSAIAQQLPGTPAYVVARRWEMLPTLPSDTIAPSDKYDPGTHFLLSYPPGESLHPGGYSGSGIWGWELSQGEVWSPKPIYTGMAVAYNRNSAALIATKLSPIRHFLDQISRGTEY
jgi:hypothetical protein